MAYQINLDTSQRVDITCRKGDTFTLVLTFNDEFGIPLDLNGYVWSLDVRETDTSSGTIIDADQFSYTGTSDGNLTIKADALTMALIEGGIYVYDLQSSNVGNVKTWLYGIFKINEDVTL
jgi:hypothetical protein